MIKPTEFIHPEDAVALRRQDNMNKFFHKRICVLFCIIICSFSTLFAQNEKPTWTQKEMQDSSVYVGILQLAKTEHVDSLSMLLYKQKAKVDALWKVFIQMPWNIEQTKSLFAVLSREGLYKASLYEILLGEMKKSPFFVSKEWEDEREYWCCVSVEKQIAKEFIEQLVDKAKSSAERIYADAKKLQIDGYVYRAAKKYVEALDSLHPAIFRYLPTPNDTGYVDFGKQIYDSYLKVYDNMVITSDISNIPAIYDEGIPMRFSISIAQGDVPLRKLGVKSVFDGLVKIDPTTDAKGECYFSIDHVASPQKEQRIEFMVDSEYLMDLPLVYGCDVLKNRFSFPSLAIPINLITPNALVCINATDSLLGQSLEQIWMSQRNDIVITKCADSADIVVTTELKIDKEKDVVTRDYKFVQYCASLKIIANAHADNEQIVDYDIRDFSIMLPASRRSEQVRETVIRELNRQIERKFPNYVKGYKYDKRKTIWSSIIPIKD